MSCFYLRGLAIASLAAVAGSAFARDVSDYSLKAGAYALWAGDTESGVTSVYASAWASGYNQWGDFWGGESNAAGQLDLGFNPTWAYIDMTESMGAGASIETGINVGAYVTADFYLSAEDPLVWTAYAGTFWGNYYMYIDGKSMFDLDQLFDSGGHLTGSLDLQPGEHSVSFHIYGAGDGEEFPRYYGKATFALGSPSVPGPTAVLSFATGALLRRRRR